MIDPKAEPVGHRSPYKRVDLGARRRSWWCQPCSQEIYGERCKYCGKSEDETK